MKKIAIIVVCMMFILLTGCDDNRSGENIVCEGKTGWVFDDTNIQLKTGWFVDGYEIDYENKQVIFSIDKSEVN